MKLTLLGTGNAAATACYNTCFVFSNDGQHFLVDTGGGNQILKALQEAGIPLPDIHDIFITHEHLDHILGLFWMIRMIGKKMNQGEYEGALNIYCHSELIDKLCAIANQMMTPDVLRQIGRNILFVAVEHGDQLKLLDSDITFFDIESEKAKQLGFTVITRDGIKIACCGDEPYNPVNEEYIRECDWLMHEAFCLSEEADLFKPYEKHHSTVKDACQTAELIGVPNLILYHAEDSHLQDRKRLYTEEGSRYYSGTLHVPDDMEVFEISRTLRFPG